MKLVTVFFDLEWRRRFDLEEATKKISEVLDRHNARAVFNTCGTVVEDFPDLIKKLHNRRHEIASHGYAHENFVQLVRVGQLDEALAKTEKLIESAIGEKPIGIRSPWFHSDKMVYYVMEKRGYKWISDYNIFRTELLNKPHTKFKVMRHVFFSLLWKSYKKEPFRRGDMLEVPLLSSPDGDLFSLIDPTQDTPKAWLDFAYHALKTQFDKSGMIFNLNFHPWLIGTANRLQTLDKILSYINQKNSEFILAKELVDVYA